MRNQSGREVLLFLSVVFEVQRGRVHAVAQARVRGAVREDMAQMRAAVAADRLDTRHAVAVVFDVGDGAGYGLIKAGPAATCIKLGVRVKQLGAAANAVVAAIGPELLVLAGVGALSRRMARDLEGGRLGAFVLQQGLPFGIGFLDGKAHDEQLIEMEEAQSGGKPAQS